MIAGVGLVAGLCGSAMAVGSAAASTASQSRASGGEQGNPTKTTTFTAASAPNGEHPSGEVRILRGGPGGHTDFTGSVTCLSVHGYRATIGATGTETISGYAVFSGPFTRPQSYLVVAVDNGKPPDNMYGGPTPDLVGVTSTSTPPDCSTGSNVVLDSIDIGAGDIVVRDARDKPPRLSVPHAIRITVRNSRRVRVRYRVSARDDFDLHPVVRCSPRSGSRFPIGATLVRCTARDRSGLTRSAAFRVHVKFRAH